MPPLVTVKEEIYREGGAGNMLTHTHTKSQTDFDLSKGSIEIGIVLLNLIS